MNDAERRRAPRQSASFPIALSPRGHGETLAMAHNVSATGICLGSARHLAIGEDVMMTFRVSKNDPADHQVPGKVVRVERNAGNHIQMWRYLTAVKFEKEQAWINLFVLES